MKKRYASATPYISEMAEFSTQNNHITNDMYVEHKVNRGLRDLNGHGVATGLTEVSSITAKRQLEDGSFESAPGRLCYRGYDIKELTKGFLNEQRYGFEEIVYLLLFSELPSSEQLERFCEEMKKFRELPEHFVRDIILKAPGKDMMNALSRSVLAMYAYDDNPDDTSVDNVLRQCMWLISTFPLLAVYGYHTYRHYHKHKSLYIELPDNRLSTAENILHILRENSDYSPLEARILDLSLVLHAEHGGGNNSTFTTHVVTSSGTDTYSAISAALGSLKGPRHGGANIKVVRMFDDMKKNVNTVSEAEVRGYLEKLIDKKAFDNQGLVYGFGHAVYSVSDPRAEVLKECAMELCREKGMEEEFALYEMVERLAPEVIAEKRRIYKGVSPNVDFYSGLIYRMLNLPYELYTPFFAVSRIAGWSAHRIEEIQNHEKIIRPAYINVKEDREYVRLNDR